MKRMMVIARTLSVGVLLMGCAESGGGEPETDGPDGVQPPGRGVVSGPDGEVVDLGYQDAPSSSQSGVESNELPTEDAGIDTGSDTDSGGLGELCDDVPDACARCICENLDNASVCAGQCS